MSKTLKITTDNKVQMIDIVWDIDGFEQAIDAECVEFVSTEIMKNFFQHSICFIVDESGLVKDRAINKFATELYNYGTGGNYIAGDVLLGIREGCEILPPESIELLKFYVLDNFCYLIDADKDSDL